VYPEFATRRYELRVEASAGGVTSVLRAEGDGPASAPHAVTGRACGEVVDALALTLALSIAPDASPVAPPSAAPPPAPRPATVGKRAAREVASAGAGLAVLGPLAPSPLVGPALTFATGPLGGSPLAPSLRASARYAADAFGDRSARARFRLLAAGAAACAQPARLAATVAVRPCVGAWFGALVGEGRLLRRPKTASPFWAAAEVATQLS
jgi:hypothetical protein